MHANWTNTTKILWWHPIFKVIKWIQTSLMHDSWTYVTIRKNDWTHICWVCRTCTYITTIAIHLRRGRLRQVNFLKFLKFLINFFLYKVDKYKKNLNKKKSKLEIYQLLLLLIKHSILENSAKNLITTRQVYRII